MKQMPNISNWSFQEKDGYELLIDDEGDIMYSFERILVEYEKRFYMKGLEFGYNFGYNRGMCDQLNEIKRVLDIK